MSDDRRIEEPHLAQVGLCTDDLAGSVTLYRDVFGFGDAGGHVVWGPRLGKMQQLGEDASASQWWLVTRQDFTNLEFFNHAVPRQRPLDPGWRPCDLGWVRWGFSVPDFDTVLERLAARRIDGIAAPNLVDGLRRMCFRDPHVGVVVEVMEEGHALPGGIRPRFHDLAPALSYVTLSVRDLDVARRFYVDTLGLVEVDTRLHEPESEASWGLPDAAREAIVLRADDGFLEIVRYDAPVGRRHPDRLLSDQGIMNIAVGHRDRDLLVAMYERIHGAGYRIVQPLPDTVSAVTYVEDGDGNSVEIMSIEREQDPWLGYAPRQIPPRRMIARRGA